MSSLLQSRAQVAQAEFASQYPEGTFLPNIHEEFDTLPKRIADLCDAGKVKEAEYWLLQAECGAGVISYERLSARVRELEEPDERSPKGWKVGDCLRIGVSYIKWTIVAISDDTWPTLTIKSDSITPRQRQIPAHDPVLSRFTA